MTESRGLDRVLPKWDRRERHEIRIRATPERALAAAREVTLAEMPLVRLLFRLRGLSADSSRSVQSAMAGDGFEEIEPNLLVAAGRPWRLTEGVRKIEDLASFDEPGYAKMAVDFRALPDGDGALLLTETRVLLTDAYARRRFRLYWLVVRPFSGLVRRSWLRAAKRRVES